jgi:N-sulfoglucosamine sulfohydrolase
MQRFLFFFFVITSCLRGQVADRPNIIWIYAEDTSPWMGCYGDAINARATPHIDSIAAEGILFSRAFVPAPVCSATRSAMMIGQNCIRFGAHQHRSSRGGPKIYLPEGYELLPQIMQRHGYTTFNHGKTDYNFVWDAKVYNYEMPSKTDFAGLIERQPFFGQIQTKGGKNNTWEFPAERKVDPASVDVPADYPNNSIFRQVVAQHYDAIRKDDDLIGEILAGLGDAGLEENTIIVYFSDHGANNLLRHKQMTTEGGLQVPFVLMGPQRYVPENGVRHDLVDLLDLSATTLAWAGIDKPDWYEGRDLFEQPFVARRFVGAQKDRLDHTIDRVRTIRTDRFRYVRNYRLDRIFLQPQYRDRKDFTQNLHALYRDGQLSDRHREIYFGERPAEELYEVSTDPHMMRDLASDPNYAEVLDEHRIIMNEWLSVGDRGVEKESIEALQANGEGKDWGNGVNVEYEAYRVDSDGDGLSDTWERMNERDPEDGRLYFGFDCGGWQTEGWFSEDISSNLSGFLGFLDFELDALVGSIQRKDLQIQSRENDQSLSLVLRADREAELSVFANDRLIGTASIDPLEACKQIRLPLDSSVWKGVIDRLTIQFEAAPSTEFIIDSIEVVRIEESE